MFKATLKSIVIFLILFSFNNVHSQVSVSYFGNTNFSKVGVGYDFNENWWTELRFYSGTSIGNTTVEAVINYNFLSKEKYRTYVGTGFVINNINGLVLPIGAQFSPFEKLNNFSFHIELQPMYEVDFGIITNGFWGIRYKFN